MKHLVFGALFLVSVAGTAQAEKKPAAEPGPDAGPAQLTAAQRKALAQKLVGQGRAAFDKAHYVDAAHKFDEAYRYFPVPKMLYNIGLAYEALNKRDRAVCALERFVTEAPDADPALLSESKQKIEKLGPMVGRIEVQAPEKVQLLVDGEDRGVAPARLPLCVEQGRHRVSAVVAGGPPVGLDLDVKAGAVSRVAFDPATHSARLMASSELSLPVAAGETMPFAATSRDTNSDTTPIYKKWWLWTAVGIVVAGGVTTGLVVGLRPIDVHPPFADYGPYKVFP